MKTIFITQQQENTHYNVIERGQRFKIGGTMYILAHVDGTHPKDRTYCLIDLNDGNRWDNPSSLDQIARQLNENNATRV